MSVTRLVGLGAFVLTLSGSASEAEAGCLSKLFGGHRRVSVCAPQYPSAGAYPGYAWQGSVPGQVAPAPQAPALQVPSMVGPTVDILRIQDLLIDTRSRLGFIPVQ